jgi:hypothetical protein
VLEAWAKPMSKLAAVAERIAQTRRWLDQEADRLAARVDQIEKRAPAALQNAHRLLDDQQRDIDAIELMVQQWLSATADGANKARAPQQTAVVPPPRPKLPNDAAPAFDSPHYFLDEQQRDVDLFESALKTLATEAPAPQVAASGQSAAAQPPARNDALAAVDSRRLLDDHQKDEKNLERALQTLASKMAPQSANQQQSANPSQQQPANASQQQPAAASPLAHPEPPKSEDATKQLARKLGVVRVA